MSALACALLVLFVASCTSGNDRGTASTNSTTTVPRSSGQIQTSPATLPPDPSQTLRSLQKHFVDLVKLVRPSVVRVSTSSGLGSGIVYDGQGDIVTNAHVVGSATQFQVTWFDGTGIDASLVGKDLSNDLAVVKVSDGNGAVRVATFANSDTLQTGDVAIAIGSPLGLDSTVTEGIVSATQRTVAESSSIVLHVIQTSAAINPGNSGGALVDVDGRVIGIPTLAAKDPQLGVSEAQGIGFAIPSNTVKDVAGRLIAAHP
jgi:putative serine protease PepD